MELSRKDLCWVSSMRHVRPPRFFRLMRMSAASLATNLTLQVLLPLLGRRNSSNRRANDAISIRGATANNILLLVRYRRISSAHFTIGQQKGEHWYEVRHL